MADHLIVLVFQTDHVMTETSEGETPTWRGEFDIQTVRGVCTLTPLAAGNWALETQRHPAMSATSIARALREAAQAFEDQADT